jgi:hypothetical protein
MKRWALAALVLVPASVALAHEGDVGLAVVGGQLRTGIVQVDPSNNEWVVLGERVFAGELDVAGFAADPGFFSGPLGSASGSVTVPAGAQLGFTLNGPLQVWTGTGVGSTSARMRLEFAGGALSAVTPISAGNVSGFGLPTGTTGAFDEHWDFFLTGPSGTTGGQLPIAGVYIFETTLSLTGTSAPIASAEPIWFVLNFGASEAAHDEAIEWVEANLVPTPSVAGLLGLGAIAAMRRRRA